MKCINNNCENGLWSEDGCLFPEGTICSDFIPESESGALSPVESPATGSVPNLDQMALNHVASEMRKTAMKFVNDRDHARLMRAGELLAKAIEKDASRIGAKGLMKQNK